MRDLPGRLAGGPITWGVTGEPEISHQLDRERVLREMAEGYTQKEIATRLFVAPNTINTHVQHIYEKLHVHSNVEAVAKALRERLIS